MTVLLYWENDGNIMMKFFPPNEEFLQDLKSLPENWRRWDSIYHLWRLKEEAWPKFKLLLDHYKPEVRTLWPRAQNES